MGQLNTLANDARRRRDWTAREAIMAERKVLADALRQGKLFVLAVRVEEWRRQRAEANNLAMKMSNETFSQVLPGRAKHTRLQLARDYYQPENQNQSVQNVSSKSRTSQVIPERLESVQKVSSQSRTSLGSPERTAALRGWPRERRMGLD
jgi:hypothetical protein